MVISVIIPCFNQAEFLGEAIESILAQSINDLEIIVINDGSTDNTTEVVGGYSEVICISQENRGLAKARNRGFEESRGDYLVFLDADDQLGPNSLAAGLESLSASPSAMFTYGAMQTIGIDGNQLAMRKPYSTSNHYRELLANNFIPTPGMVMFRRAALEKYGLYDPTVPASADYDLCLRITRHEMVVSHPEVAVLRRFHANAMTGNPGLMLRTTLKVHQRQWREVRTDSDLVKSFKTGRQFWKEWYGDQILTVLRINIFQRQWRLAIWNLILLVRFRVGALWQLLTRTSKSNSLIFKVFTEDPALSDKDVDRAPFNINPDGVTITSLNPSQIKVNDRLPLLWNKFLLITVECKQANKCAQLFVNHKPMDTVWVNKRQMVGCFPVELLDKEGDHEIYFIS